MMSISLLSLRNVFINCSGSLWMPTQQPLTKIFVALWEKKKQFKFEKEKENHETKKKLKN